MTVPRLSWVALGRVPVALLVVCLGLVGSVPSAPSDALAAAVAKVAGTGPLRSSCKEVAHLGDSTSDGLVSPDFLPDPAQRIPAQYARVGVSRSVMEVVGANSIVETLPGDENGYEIAQGLVAEGYRGCWVMALGTNDAADVYVGSNVGLPARIERMMSVIGHEPVLWVNVKTLLSSGPYAEANMQQWDNALLAACPEYPEHARVRLGAPREPRLVHDGRHPLHLYRFCGPRRRYRRRPGDGLPSHDGTGHFGL